MFNKKTIEDIDLKGKKVLVRVDYNVPLDENLNITDDTRIRLSIPTLEYLLKNNTKIILMAHLGRPKGKPEDKYRLDPAAERLEKLIGRKVKKFDQTYSGSIKNFIDSQIGFPVQLTTVQSHRRLSDGSLLKDFFYFVRDCYRHGTPFLFSLSPNIAFLAKKKSPGFLKRKPGL